MSYYMNPFDFVPLPENGPIQVPDEISNSTERYEGIINYSIHVKTTLHISGKIQSGRERDETVYSKKYFLFSS